MLEMQELQVQSLGQGIQKHSNNDPIGVTAKETQLERTDCWTVGEGEGGMI